METSLILILILILILNGIREAMRQAMRQAMREALPLALRQAWPSHLFFAAAVPCFDRCSKTACDFRHSLRQRG